MNEPNKITTVEKTVKVKDPKKVELGKILATISREAKERKAKLREMEMKKEEENKILDYIDFKYVVGGVTILGGLIGLYFSYKKDKREERYMENNVLIEEETKNKKKRSAGCLENL